MDDEDLDELLGGSASDDDDFEDDQTEIGDELDFATGGKTFHRTLAVTRADSVRKGAPAEWFAKVLGIGRTTVNRKLDGVVDPIHVNAKGTKYFRPSEAFPYLVQPHDLKTHLLKMNPRDLPERLRKEFWGARKLEQEVRLRAGDLYLAPDVHRSYGDLMKLVKDTVMLWTDDLDEAVGLTAEQVEILDTLARKLLTDFAGAVEQYISQGNTRSQESELDEDFDDA